MPRKTTNLLIDLAETEVIEWETLARQCLNYMSEAQVVDMAEAHGYELDDYLDDEDNE